MLQSTFRCLSTCSRNFGSSAAVYPSPITTRLNRDDAGPVTCSGTTVGPSTTACVTADEALAAIGSPAATAAATASTAVNLPVLTTRPSPVRVILAVRSLRSLGRACQELPRG